MPAPRRRPSGAAAATAAPPAARASGAARAGRPRAPIAVAAVPSNRVACPWRSPQSFDITRICIRRDKSGQAENRRKSWDFWAAACAPAGPWVESPQHAERGGHPTVANPAGDRVAADGRDHSRPGAARDVSTRTIRRDLQALQEAGFAVYDEGDEHETKRWRLDGQPFKAVQDGLSVTDVAALYLSRSVVESLPGWPLADELGAAFGKIERALNPRVREFLATCRRCSRRRPGPPARRPPTRRRRHAPALRRDARAARSS